MTETRQKIQISKLKSPAYRQAGDRQGRQAFRITVILFVDKLID